MIQSKCLFLVALHTVIISRIICLHNYSLSIGCLFSSGLNLRFWSESGVAILKNVSFSSADPSQGKLATVGLYLAFRGQPFVPFARTLEMQRCAFSVVGASFWNNL